MKFEELLPIGSVVRLKDAKKKIVIMGVMPMKHTPEGTDIIHDYLGVPYPEGYLTKETGLLFNHEKIDEIVFRGYTDHERETFVNVMSQIVSNADKVAGR